MWLLLFVGDQSLLVGRCCCCFVFCASCVGDTCMVLCVYCVPPVGCKVVAAELRCRCCLLFATCWLLFVACCSSCVARCLLCVVYRLMRVVCALFTVCRLLCACVCWSLFAYKLSFVVWRVLLDALCFVVCGLRFVFCVYCLHRGVCCLSYVV